MQADVSVIVMDENGREVGCTGGSIVSQGRSDAQVFAQFERKVRSMIRRGYFDGAYEMHITMDRNGIISTKKRKI